MDEVEKEGKEEAEIQYEVEKKEKKKRIGNDSGGD